MDIEYITDVTGKVTDILIDGKPVKRSYMRGFRKAQEKPYFRIIPHGREFTNPISGESIYLNSLEGTIYNFCISWYIRFEQGREDNTQLYDDMKYFLLELNSNAYMTLID